VIVLDASAAAELVLESSAGHAVGRRVRDEALHCPAHFDVEVVGVIRRAVIQRIADERTGAVAFAAFRQLPVRRWSIPPLLDRGYALRATHTISDAVYVALAEWLDAPLVTCDARLARSHGHNAMIQLV
jgi:predicted nucleic acid-binding protein